MQNRAISAAVVFHVNDHILKTHTHQALLRQVSAFINAHRIPVYVLLAHSANGDDINHIRQLFKNISEEYLYVYSSGLTASDFMGEIYKHKLHSLPKKHIVFLSNDKEAIATVRDAHYSVIFADQDNYIDPAHVLIGRLCALKQININRSLRQTQQFFKPAQSLPQAQSSIMSSIANTQNGVISLGAACVLSCLGPVNEIYPPLASKLCMIMALVFTVLGLYQLLYQSMNSEDRLPARPANAR